MGVYDILDEIQRPVIDQNTRMNHPIPKTVVVDRVKYILEKCRDKLVLDIGSSGTDNQAIIFREIAKVAREAQGVDRTSTLPNIYIADVNEPGWAATIPPREYDLVVCGEVLEHLGNPEGFLLEIRSQIKPSAEVLITVPNALSHNGLKHAQKGIEHVNIDHVAWYSWRTLKTLVERCGYEVIDFKWYNGVPTFAEGIIFLCKGKTDGRQSHSEVARQVGEDKQEA